MRASLGPGGEDKPLPSHCFWVCSRAGAGVAFHTIDGCEGCISHPGLPPQRTTHRVASNNRNLSSPSSGDQKAKSRCHGATHPPKAPGGSFLDPLSFWWPQAVLGLWLQHCNPCSVFTRPHPHLCVSPFLLLRTPVIGFRDHTKSVSSHLETVT